MNESPSVQRSVWLTLLAVGLTLLLGHEHLVQAEHVWLVLFTGAVALVAWAAAGCGVMALVRGPNLGGRAIGLLCGAVALPVAAGWSLFTYLGTVGIQ